MASTLFTKVLPRLGLITATLICAGTATTLVAGDDNPPAVSNPAGTLAFTVTAPSGKTAQELSNIVKSAAMRRGWTIKESSASRVVIYLNHRHNEATVTFDITDTTINAYTVPTKKTDRWLRFLHKDIEVALGLPTK